MPLLLWISNIFISTFGITQPTPAKARQMALFIGVLLGGLLLAFFAAALLLRASFHA